MLNETDLDKMLEISYRELWAIPQAEVESYQLNMLKKRFADLRAKVVTLDKLASHQNVDEINALEDVVPLCFQHTTYKSYPISFLEKGKYVELTRWLDRLTAHDLSAVDASGCQSIDQWLELLDAETSVRAVHSSGTSGKLSLIPRDERETHRFTLCHLHRGDGFGDEPDTASEILAGTKKMPLVYPSYRHGRYGANRLVADLSANYCDTARTICLNEGWMSADVISLAGRVAGAEARGELDQLEIPDALLRKYKETMAQRASQKDTEAHFLDRVLSACAGEDTMIIGPVPLQMAWVDMLRERGLEKVFGPGSMIMSGGGAKGLVLPDDWKEQIHHYLGVPVSLSYGMSECTFQYPDCAQGNYHATPHVIPFVLDVDTGRPLPREGAQTGRYGFFDLLAESYWGGFVTGDKITGHWGGCPCGREGFYVEPTITRYSDISADGDDKINCAGAANAHERALEFLNDVARGA